MENAYSDLRAVLIWIQVVTCKFKVKYSKGPKDISHNFYQTSHLADMQVGELKWSGLVGFHFSEKCNEVDWTYEVPLPTIAFVTPQLLLHFKPLQTNHVF